MINPFRRAGHAILSSDRNPFAQAARRWRLTTWLALLTACTYNEYNTIEAGETDPDGGSTGRGSALGGSGPLGSGAGGASGNALGGASGSAGNREMGLAGTGGAPSDAGCTGCVRLLIPGNAASDLRLTFDEPRDLADTTLAWRVRVRDGLEDVFFSMYAQSGNAPEETFREGSARISAASGWQEVGVDLSGVPAFNPPAFVEGAGGGGFDPGFPFDKTRVRWVGLQVSHLSQPGLLTPATIEIDILTFSDQPGLNVDFSVGVGGVELYEAGGATLTHTGL